MAEWIALIGCILGLLGAIYSVIKVVTKSIMVELLPNSGKSLRDEIRDGFIPPKCHDEATVNELCLWDCTNKAHDPIL